MAAIIGNTVKDIININYKVIMEEVYFEIIIKRSAIFVKSQIAGQLDTPLMSVRGHITSFIRV